jgi:hypothetical protein
MLKTFGAFVGRLPWLCGVANSLSLSGNGASGRAQPPLEDVAVKDSARPEAAEFLSAEAGPLQLRSTIATRMQEGRRLIVAGLPLSEVARLCLEHGYRWRLKDGEAVNGHPRFDLMPGQPAAPLGNRPSVRRPAAE